MYGDKQFKQARPLFPTPEDTPEVNACRTFRIPASSAWLGLFMGAVSLLTDPDNYQQFEGGMTPDEAAEVALAVLLQAYDDAEYGCTPNYPTPFWDEASDLLDEASGDDQIWYGEVTDPDAPADELTFVENAAIWGITGFIAYAGQIGGAVFFNTIAPRFVLAWKAGDIGEVIRVVVDAADYGTVDTSTVAAGEVITLDVLPVEDTPTHDILLVKVS